MDELVVVVATMAQVSVTQAEKGVELAEATQQLRHQTANTVNLAREDTRPHRDWG